MMTTRHENSLFSRPMAMQDTEFEGTLYFLTGKKTGKCSDLEKYPKVNLAFSHPGKNCYLSLSGDAELLDDRTKIVELWKTFDTAYFPKGPEDRDIVLIKVEAQSVEYWDSPSSSLVQAYHMVKTALTGEWDAMGDSITETYHKQSKRIVCAYNQLTS